MLRRSLWSHAGADLTHFRVALVFFTKSAWLRKAQGGADPTGCDRKPRVSDDSGFVQSGHMGFAGFNRK